jgi:hypothetical protein
VPADIVPPEYEAPALGSTTRFNAWLAVFPPLSVACTVKLQVCAGEGVPEMIPVEAPSDSPLHSEPAVMLQEIGIAQPAVRRVVE